MKFKFLGHGCFSIETKGIHLIIDPFISGNELAKSIDINSLKADYILLTHGHQDHVLDAEAIAKRTGAKIISNFEIVNWYGQKGIKGHPMNHGGKWQFDFGTVKFVNAVHSSVLPDGTYGGNAGGFVIWNEETSFYFAGDTALTMDMKLIPMLCPQLDFCILPVGDNFTMGIEESVIASKFVNCDKVISCHFDTFGFIITDKDELKSAFKKEGKDIFIPKIGEYINI